MEHCCEYNGSFCEIAQQVAEQLVQYYGCGINGNFTYKASKAFTITSYSGYMVPLRTPNNTFPDNYFYGFNLSTKFSKKN
jgi:hypothetical protein